MDTPLADLHAIEETIRCIEENPDVKREDLIQHLSWYWHGGQNKNINHHPREWVIDWINCLTGEYNYEDFNLRRPYVSSRRNRMELPRE